MSLTIIERRNTKKELAANFNLAGVTLEQAAQDLATTPEHVEAVLQLQVDQIEEPWILRNYLNKQLAAQGKTPLPYSRLQGNPAVHWFLNTDLIAKGRLN
ncbi:MAG: DUF2316 family protein [Lacticaseibacillus paracasei]|nr:DUF2316 family protein [Lacticaseibacillus paracasei]